MAKLTPAEKRLLSICKKTLDSIIRDWSSDIEADPEVVLDGNVRFRLKDRLMVEKAIDKMWVLLLDRKDNVFDGVPNTNGVRHRAYRHAVDAYFSFYFGVAPSTTGAGRPRTELQELCELLKLRRQNKTIREICVAIQWEPTPKNINRIGKRLKEAEMRCDSGSGKG